MEPLDQGLNPSIAYIANVLGVESFMLGENGAPAIENPQMQNAQVGSVFALGSHTAALVFIASDDTVSGEAFTPDKNELLDRMITAMKQEPGQVLKLSFLPGSATQVLQTIATTQPRAVVALGIETAKQLAGLSVQEGTWFQTQTGIEILATRSLEDILADAGLKRSVWTHLQSAMRKLT